MRSFAFWCGPFVQQQLQLNVSATVDILAHFSHVSYTEQLQLWDGGGFSHMNASHKICNKLRLGH